MAVLNTGDLPVGVDACPAISLSRDLQRLMLRMKAEHMSEDGRGVDYRGLRESQVFGEYQEKTTLLRTVDILSLEANEKLAFFIST